MRAHGSCVGLPGAQVLIPCTPTEWWLFRTAGGTAPLIRGSLWGMKREKKDILNCSLRCQTMAPFLAGRQLESVAVKWYRPHLENWIAHCTLESIIWNSRRRTAHSRDSTTAMRCFEKCCFWGAEKKKKNKVAFISRILDKDMFTFSSNEALKYLFSLHLSSPFVTTVVISVKAADLWSCCQEERKPTLEGVDTSHRLGLR